MRKQWIAVAALTVLALSGCAPTEDPAAAPSPAPTAEPTPEAVAGPERVFDGDCAALGSADDLSADAGAPLALVDDQWPAEIDYSTFPQVGGIHCVWSGAADTDLSVSAIVLPSRSISEARPTGTQCEPGAHCTFGVIESGFQLFGIVIQAGADSATLQGAADSLTARMASSLAGAALPAPYEPEGSWASTIDCATLDAGHAIATVLNDPTLEGYSYGGDAEPNPGYYVALGASGLTHCDWISPPGDGASVSVDLMPGGAWRQGDNEGHAHAPTVEGPGFVGAVVIGDTLHAFTEVNRLDLTLDPADTGLTLPDFFPAAAAIAAELDAR
jgi:hypothetical protein